jgi:hypothetical protein
MIKDGSKSTCSSCGLVGDSMERSYSGESLQGIRRKLHGNYSFKKYMLLVLRKHPLLHPFVRHCAP